MAKTICLIDEQEGTRLRKGQKLDCRRHRHIGRQEARLMALGGSSMPWQHFDNFNPVARWATMPNGSTSQKHIIEMEAHEWRKVTQRAWSGGLGFAVMQLVSQARSQ